MRIAFIGTSELGIPALDALTEEGTHEILVFTKPDQQAGRGRRIISSPIKEAAQRLGLPCREPENINAEAALAAVSGFAPDVIVTASYWAKLSGALLEIPGHGGFNIHPSLLPRFRGAAPIQHAILHGDARTGVTIFRMGPRMDAGEILGQADIAVEPGDTSKTLHDKLARLAAPLLRTVLEGLERGTLNPVLQDESSAVQAPKLTKEEGAIRWEEPAERIERRVRAMVPWPGAYTFHRHGRRTLRLILTQCRVAQGTWDVRNPKPGEVVNCEDKLVVACGSGFLEILRLKREGKGELSVEAFLRGMPVMRGARFSEGARA